MLMHVLHADVTEITYVTMELFAGLLICICIYLPVFGDTQALLSWTVLQHTE